MQSTLRQSHARREDIPGDVYRFSMKRLPVIEASRSLEHAMARGRAGCHALVLLYPNHRGRASLAWSRAFIWRRGTV